MEGPYSDAMARYLVHKTRYNEMLVKLGGHPLRITADTDVSQRFWDTTAKAVMS